MTRSSGDDATDRTDHDEIVVHRFDDGDLRIVQLDPRHAKQCEELELAVFHTIDPSDLYHEHEMLDLYDAFPEGNFVVLDAAADDRVIGMGLGILLEFDFDNPYHGLREIEGDGGIGNHHPDSPWYYGTDISVYPEYRGRGIGKALYEQRKRYVQEANKAGIVAGGVIPGYADHLGLMSADEYVEKVVAGDLYDPTLTFQLENGFRAGPALPDYLHDPTVGNWAVLIVWDNPDWTGAGGTEGRA